MKTQRNTTQMKEQTRGVSMLLKVMTVINKVIKKKQNNYSIENNQTLREEE